jgi:ABC-type phosphate/phosphonate transport system substrate-binding protein
MNPTTPRFVALGMYAFTEIQQSSWQQLFTRFCELSGVADESVTLGFNHDPAHLLEPGLWFGHTCGYPLMTRLKDYVSPFCVPLFDVSGTDGKFYSSRIIVAADSDIDSIEASKGCVAVMNNPDSNSGMNVLRHAVAEVSDSEQFFASVVTSGGHLHSLESVANGSADIAAIDCVSYQLIADWRPQLCADIRIIGDSVKTCGLPLVMPHADIADADITDANTGTMTGAMIDCLNQALALCDDAVRDTLHLNGFASVQLDDYRSIVEIEQYAIQRGYPELN